MAMSTIKKAFLKSTASLGKQIFYQSILVSIFLPIWEPKFIGIWNVLVPLAIFSKIASEIAQWKLNTVEVEHD